MDMQRKNKAIENAQAAFWKVIAVEYPEAKTGDIDPIISHDFDMACNVTVGEWIKDNVKPAKINNNCDMREIFCAGDNTHSF